MPEKNRFPAVLTLHAVGFQSSQSGVRLVDTHATLDANNGPRRHNGVICPQVVHGTQDPITADDCALTLGRNSGQENAVAAAHAIRRLTPRECERLQGFNGDHTLIPWRVKPAADGPRYKAIGNSMAVPVMHWIGQRIKQELEKP